MISGLPSGSNSESPPYKSSYWKHCVLRPLILPPLAGCYGEYYEYPMCLESGEIVYRYGDILSRTKIGDCEPPEYVRIEGWNE